MMSNINAVPAFDGASLKEIAEALGITQFISETNWYQTIAGLLIQGGKTEDITTLTSSTISFNAGFNKQVLGIWTQGIYTTALAVENSGVVDTITLQDFVLRNGGATKPFFWFAIGV